MGFQRETGRPEVCLKTESKPRLRQFEELGLGFKFQGFCGHHFYNHQRENPSAKHMQVQKASPKSTC